MLKTILNMSLSFLHRQHLIVSISKVKIQNFLQLRTPPFLQIYLYPSSSLSSPPIRAPFLLWSIEERLYSRIANSLGLTFFIPHRVLKASAASLCIHRFTSFPFSSLPQCEHITVNNPWRLFLFFGSCQCYSSRRRGS